MGLDLIRHGVPKPPEYAYICPSCGEKANEYVRAELRIQKHSIQGSDFYEAYETEFEEKPLVPQFTCRNCTCMWQWLPDVPISIYVNTELEHANSCNSERN